MIESLAYDLRNRLTHEIVDASGDIDAIGAQRNYSRWGYWIGERKR